MGAIDDIRKLLQDVVTPDFKALQARVTALDEKMEVRFEDINLKIDLTRDRLLTEIKEMRVSNERSIANLTHALELERRMTKIENERAPEAKPHQLERPV